MRKDPRLGQKYRYLTTILLLFVQISHVFAGTVRFTGDSKGRDGNQDISHLNFYHDYKKNVIAIVPKGARGEVLERVLLPSGNYGLKIELTSIPEGSRTQLKKGAVLWVYYDRDKELRSIELRDDNDALVESPIAGKWAISLKVFRVPKQYVLKNPLHHELCVTGQCDPGQSNPVLSQLNQAHLGDLSLQLSGDPQVKDPTQSFTLDPVVEEMATEIGKKQPRNSRGTNRTIAKAILNASRLEGVDPLFVLAIIRQESFFDPKAVSDEGAQGLMQLMPKTARSLARELGIRNPNSFDIETNVRLGVHFIAHLLHRYKSKEAALAAYNMGEPNYDRLRGRYTRIPETRRYVPSVLSKYRTYLALREKGVLDPHPLVAMQ